MTMHWVSPYLELNLNNGHDNDDDGDGDGGGGGVGGDSEIKDTATPRGKLSRATLNRMARRQANRHCSGRNNETKLIEAKWRDEPKFRGQYGETLAHILIINNTRVHTELLCESLFVDYPQLIDDIMTGEHFYGVTCLHLAIAYSNRRLITTILNASTKRINQRCTGTFFLSSGHRGGTMFNSDSGEQMSKKKANTAHMAKAEVTTNGTNNNSKNSIVSRLCFTERTNNNSTTKRPEMNEMLHYCGEYPLAWCVCFNDKVTYQKLLQLGADPNLNDGAFGNTCLHLIVLKDQRVSFAVRLPTL